MFTGIIQAVGSVISTTPTPFGAQLIIDTGDWTCSPKRGDSIAVNGVCLTYAPTDNAATTHLTFDVIRETLERSTLSSLKPADKVNLEPSLTPDSPLGGHFVQGHVDAVGTIADFKHTPDESRLTIQTTPKIMPYLIPKGSITIDGISLTLASVNVSANRFTVALIPTTLALTTLNNAKPGNKINLETDMIARTIIHYLTNFNNPDNPANTSITLDKLHEAGF